MTAIGAIISIIIDGGGNENTWQTISTQFREPPAAATRSGATTQPAIAD